MTSGEQRQELAAFLKAKRQGLRPGDVGLPAGVKHRRTPGLRREEVAQRAGIDASWYTKLEQGQQIRLSPKALHGIAAALTLTPAEREYLFSLARADLLPVTPSPRDTVSATLQAVLDAQGDNPAYITDARLNLLAWNQAAVDVFGAFGNFHRMPPEERNILWLIFTDNSRSLLVDWERHAKRLLAQFRDASRHFVNDPWFAPFIDKLKQASPEFTEWWTRYDVERVQETEKLVDHPAVGQLVLKQTVLQVVDDSPGLFMIVYTPGPDTDTADKLQKLAIDAR